MFFSNSVLKEKVKEWNAKEDSFIFSAVDLSLTDVSVIYRIHSTELKNEIQKIIDDQKQEDDELEPVEAFCFNRGIHSKYPHNYLSAFWRFKVDKKELYEGAKANWDSIIYLLNEDKFQMIEDNELAQLLSISPSNEPNEREGQPNNSWKYLGEAEARQAVFKSIQGELYSKQYIDKKNLPDSLSNSGWVDELWKIEISQLESFKSKMLREIKKARDKISSQEERFGNEIPFSYYPQRVADEILAKLKSSGVFEQGDLDPSLWSPYHLWAEKLVSLTEISEMETFKNQMFSAIEEAAKNKKQQNSNNDSDRRDKENTPTDNNKNKPEKKDSPASSPSNSDQEKDLTENLKREIETLKANQNRTAVQEVKLSKKEQKLRELEKDNDNIKSSKSQNSNLDNNFPTGWDRRSIFVSISRRNNNTFSYPKPKKEEKNISLNL